MSEADARAFPTIAQLNAATVHDFSAAVALLFEPAPRFAGWLAAARPFRSDEDMLKASARVAHRMADEDKVQLVNAHPRLGARGPISAASRREQGRPSTRVDQELARLQAEYEARFGFHYLVFVAGRSKSQLVPELRAALKRNRQAELARAIDDTLAIAADRLHWFRSATEGAA